MKQFNLGCLGGLGLGLLMILCPWVQQGQIERDLTQATRAALEGRGLADWDISFSGLDATLRGPEREAETVRALLRTVPGIAQIRIVTPEQEAAMKVAQQATGASPAPRNLWSTRPNAPQTPVQNSGATLLLPTASTTPAPTPAPLSATPAPVAATPSPSPTTATGLVQILRHDGLVYVRGAYPDTRSARVVLAAARQAFGSTVVFDETSFSVDGRTMGWPLEALDALSTLRSVPDLELALGGDVVIVAGSVPSDTARRGILTALKAKIPAGIVVEDRLRAAGVEPTLPTPPASTTPPQESQAALDRVVLSGEVRFATASSRLQPTTYGYLDRIAQTIQAQKDTPLLIGGHTDSEGDARVNQRLSQKRADAVRAYLIACGLSSQRLFARGFGSTQPIASNATDEGRRRNRRITFTFR